MRFRKSIKLLPGVKLNLSKNGISASVGPRGATVNLKPGMPARVTTGIPGTGLSQSVTLADNDAENATNLAAAESPSPPLWLSALRITWSVVTSVGVIVLAVLGGIAAALMIGKSKRK